MRPRSPAEHPPDNHGGDLGGARVCRGAWRYAPLPQREVGNLALLRRSRIRRAAASEIRDANSKSRTAGDHWCATPCSKVAKKSLFHHPYQPCLLVAGLGFAGSNDRVALAGQGPVDMVGDQRAGAAQTGLAEPCRRQILRLASRFVALWLMLIAMDVSFQTLSTVGQ